MQALIFRNLLWMNKYNKESSKEKIVPMIKKFLISLIKEFLEINYPHNKLRVSQQARQNYYADFVFWLKSQNRNSCI